MEPEINKMSLKRLACLSVAISIWEQEHIKTKTKEFFYSKSKLDNREKWYNIIRDILEKVMLDILPAVLHCELLYTIKNIGIRMFEWFRYLRKTRLFGLTPRKTLYENYAKKIYWTCYGTIDEVKTLKLVWLNNPNVNVSKVYNMACCYCLEENISDLWKKIPRNIQLERYTYDNLYRQLGLNILAYWDDFRNSSSRSLIDDFVRYNDDDEDFYNPNITIEENMLKLCMEEGYHIGFKYFWDKLDDDKRLNNVVSCLKDALGRFMGIILVRQYRKDRYIKICIFLYRQLNDKMKKEIFLYGDEENGEGNDYLMAMKDVFLESWPWNEFILPELEELLEFCNKKQYSKIFESITLTMDRENEFNLPIQHSELQRKFYQLWHRCPKEYKSSLAFENISSLFDVWDLSSVKLLLNDEDLVEDRRSLLLQGTKELFKMMEENEDALVEEFFCELLVFKNWDPKIQAVLREIYKFLLKNDLNSAKEFLKSELSSDDDRKFCKQKLDAKFVSYYLIVKEEFFLADEFLAWKFESGEKVENFKNRFKRDHFSRDLVFKFWSGPKENIETARNKSDNFLNWMCKTENEIEDFKINKLQRKISEKNKYTGYYVYRRQFANQGHFESLDNFLSWCLMTPEEMKKLRKLVLSEEDGKSSLCEMFLKNGEFETCEKFLKWAFDDEDSMKDFIVAFMLSGNGLASLKYFVGIESALEEEPELKEKDLAEKYEKFINIFIKPFLSVRIKVEDWLDVWKYQSIENDEETGSEVNDRSDYSSPGQSDSEMSDDGLRNYEVFCQQKKLNLFLKVLNKSSDVELGSDD